ncbi:MAG: ketoacyl-ACP synthase III [Lachnospiraceae bacterium]|nr:ketoacyl-ACP synthase III [Lachnospiraceae bacterium]
MTGKIIGTGSYLPELVWNNHKLTEWLDTNDEWIRERTGIGQRHISKDLGAGKMALEAAKKAMEDAGKAGLRAEDLDAIFVCTVTPDIMVPSIACEIQKTLGAVNAFAYDINAACSGFVFAYNMAVAYMETGLIKNALIVGSEQLSSMMDWNDRGSCILFGDGAGALVVTACEQKGASVMHSDGASGEALQCVTGGKLSMDGQKVFRFALKRVPEVVEELLAKMEMEKDQVDLFLLHQANMRIIEAVIKRLGLEPEKVPSNIERMGNTSSASLPILLDELNREGKLRTGMKLVMAGFGAGLTWGAGFIMV